MNDTMNTKDKYILAGVALALVIAVIFFGRMFTTGGDMAEGTVIEKDYSPPGVGIGVGSNGQTTTIISSEKYTLIIIVYGRTDGYSVSSETYSTFSIGDKIPMVCNKYVCGVIE